MRRANHFFCRLRLKRSEFGARWTENCAKDVELGARSEGAADEGTGFKSFGRVLEVVYCLVPDFLWDSLYRHDGKAKKGRLIPSLTPSHAQTKCRTFFGIATQNAESENLSSYFGPV
jgi:hypothetical protein